MHVQKTFEVSERRACRVLEHPRSSQRYLSTKVVKDTALAERMVALSEQNPRATATIGIPAASLRLLQRR